MGFRFDDQSRDSLDARRSARPSFSMLRARKRELLDEQRSGWAEGRPVPPEDVPGPLAHRPGQRPGRRQPAPGRLPPEAAAGRGRQPVGLPGAIPRAGTGARGAPGAGDGLPLDGPGERGHGLSPPPARRGRRGLRLPPVPAPRRGRVRPGIPGGAGRPGGPARRPEDLATSKGTEPQTLAQLLHTNIVPIYSLHEDRRAGLRAVCMPYLGGASLSAVLATLWADSPRPVSGEQFVPPWRRSRRRGPTRFRRGRRRARGQLATIPLRRIPAGRGDPPGGPAGAELRARGGLDRGPARRGAAPRRTSGASSTATSSRRTSSSAPRGSRCSWTSTSPRPRTRTRRTPRSAGPSPTWPPSTSAPWSAARPR